VIFHIDPWINSHVITYLLCSFISSAFQRHLYAPLHTQIFICKHIKYNGMALILLHILWGPFLHHFLGLWAGNAKLFNVNKFYYCYFCVSFVLVSTVLLFYFLSLSVSASIYSVCFSLRCGILFALQLHIQHFIVFHFKFNAP